MSSTVRESDLRVKSWTDEALWKTPRSVVVHLELPYPAGNVSLQLTCVPEAGFRGWLLDRQGSKKGLLLHTASKQYCAVMSWFDVNNQTVLSNHLVPAPTGYNNPPYKAFVHNNQLYMVHGKCDSNWDMLLVGLADNGSTRLAVNISPTSTRVTEGELYDVEFEISPSDTLLTVTYIYYEVEYRHSHTQRYSLLSGQLVDG